MAVDHKVHAGVRVFKHVDKALAVNYTPAITYGATRSGVIDGVMEMDNNVVRILVAPHQPLAPGENAVIDDAGSSEPVLPKQNIQKIAALNRIGDATERLEVFRERVL